MRFFLPDDEFMEDSSSFSPTHSSKDVTFRICLSCQNSFESTHKCNRMCRRCKEILRPTRFTENVFSVSTSKGIRE